MGLKLSRGDVRVRSGGECEKCHNASITPCVCGVCDCVCACMHAYAYLEILCEVGSEQRESRRDVLVRSGGECEKRHNASIHQLTQPTLCLKTED